MASGHVNRTNRPNTWAHRPICIGEKSPCQLGAVHTWGYNGLNADMPPWPNLDPSLPFDDQFCRTAQQRSRATVW